MLPRKVTASSDCGRENGSACPQRLQKRRAQGGAALSQSLVLTPQPRPSQCRGCPCSRKRCCLLWAQGCRSSLHSSESLTLCPGWGCAGEGIWTASGEVVSFWFEPGMQCSSNSPESAQSGSRAASRFPRLSKVTQSSIQTKI